MQTSPAGTAPPLIQEFAVNLRNQASAIHEVPPPKSFTFLHDACRALEQARKVVAVEGKGRGEGGKVEALEERGFQKREVD